MDTIATQAERPSAASSSRRHPNAAIGCCYSPWLMLFLKKIIGAGCYFLAVHSLICYKSHIRSRGNCSNSLFSPAPVWRACKIYVYITAWRRRRVDGSTSPFCNLREITLSGVTYRNPYAVTFFPLSAHKKSASTLVPDDVNNQGVRFPGVVF